MGENNTEYIDVTLALIELDFDVDTVEGYLLMAGGQDTVVTPSRLAREVSLSQKTASDLLLQLRRIDAASQMAGDSSRFMVRAGRVREVFSSVREMSNIISRYRERQPETTTVTPLVTIPDDPEIAAVEAEAIGMDWLMPTLVRMIKQASTRITILTPFFEGDGLDRLKGPLLNALERGVKIQIVTRYLFDESSYNRRVLTRFWESASDRGINMGLLSFFDYTVWSDDVPQEKRRQDGATPSYTLHAKILLIDEREVYVGSANVTDYGFDRFLELGVHMEGPVIESYSEVAQLVLNSKSAERWKPE